VISFSAVGIVVAYFLALAFVVWIWGKAKENTMAEYAVASRGAPWYMMLFTVLGSWIVGFGPYRDCPDRRCCSRIGEYGPFCRAYCLLLHLWRYAKCCGYRLCPRAHLLGDRHWGHCIGY